MSAKDLFVLSNLKAQRDSLLNKEERTQEDLDEIDSLSEKIETMEEELGINQDTEEEVDESEVTADDLKKNDETD